MSLSLFDPVKIGSIALKNRVVMAPLTRNRAAAGNVPHALNATYYAQRASAGLIITEATPISEMGHGYPATPGIHSDAQVAGWRQVVDAVHARGGKIVLQLWHVGRISHPSLLPDNALPVAPSALKPAGQAFTYTGLQDFVTPRALRLEEIPALIDDYAQATRNALAAGFDGVEIHAGNGYLLDQFLRDGTNKRTDQYGGGKAGRSRLLFEIAETVLAVAGAERVGVRISPLNLFNDIDDSNPQELFNHVAQGLSALNLAYLHVIEGGMNGVPAALPFDFLALREHFSGVYVANCGYSRDRANAAIAAGRADLVAFGTLFIANPDLVERFVSDAPLNEPDSSKFYGGGEAGYTDYPTLQG